MKIDKIITLENGEKYLLIHDILLFGKKYFIGTLVDEEVETNFKVFECIKYKNNYFFKEENDKNIIQIIFDKIINTYENI